MLELVFWFSLSAVFYVYIGYPIAVWALGWFIAVPIRYGNSRPRVTIVIAAFNEEDVIAATIRNKLELDYPADRFEVLVVSDGSTDSTDEIVRSFKDPRVRLLRQEPRAGKTSAHNLAVPYVQGEIIVFSDANSLYSKESLRHLVSNFSDNQVGYVTGKMVYTNPDDNSVGEGCSAYMRYENSLRLWESRIGSVVGVDGGIDAIRRELYIPMNPDQLPDFVLPLQVVKQGFRVVYEPRALLWEHSLRDSSDEYRMRVRVSLRALWALFDMRQLLNFARDPLFAWQLWSHKIMRYLCFLFLVAILVSNILLLEKGLFYQSVLLLQVTGYLAACLMPILEPFKMGFTALRFAHYFTLINLACAHAFIKFLLGRKQVIWAPRKG